ncbi:glycosyltransferase [Carbonactinospora thermoautotrophica]|uniref:glycosyltransferase n=1 Tax=Carbonactinospora thermoautotrophica TaxID=1469144 RepID=UPI0008329DA2|nr:glycosyltransferase [Carbonactinospora thermoautotrophica]
MLTKRRSGSPPRLLYLAFYFPPTRASGVYRSRATANHFAAKGWDVTVLTAPREFFTDYIDSYDPSLESTVHPDVTVERVGLNLRRWERDIRKYSAFRANFPALYNTVNAKTQDRFFPEPYASWIRPLVSRALKLHAKKRFDLILATGNPFAAFAAAWIMGKLMRIPYVLDYRDSWTLDLFTDEVKYPPNNPVWKWERRVIRDAAEIVFVNEALRSWHAERYPFAADRMTVVLNGWEPEILGEVPIRMPDPARPLEFGFLGTITEVMPLEVLFDSWRLARKEPPLADAKLRLYGHLGFFPQSAARLRPRIPLDEDLGVTYEGPVPKAEVSKAYSELDILVFLAAGVKYITSGKVFEYMATGKPIVSVHDPRIAATEVLRGYPLWFSVPELEPALVRDAMVAAAAAARDLTEEQVRAARRHARRFTRDAVLDPFEQRLRAVAHG